MSLPVPSMSFSPFAILTAEEMNDLVENIEALSAGTGLADSAITTDKIADGAVTFGKTTGIWWEELGRTTLSVAGDSMLISSIAPRKYLRLIVSAYASGTINARVRFNGDTSTSYVDRAAVNGGADGTGLTQTSGGLSGFASANDRFITADIINIQTKEKLVLGSYIDRGTAGNNAPNRAETALKWINTSSLISSVNIINIDTGDFAIGSEVIVLGHD